MRQYSIRFVVVNDLPTSTDQADRLSIQMTMDHGSQGWQLVSSLNLPAGGLLLVFQKEEIS